MAEVRYRAPSRYAYSLALLTLVEFARGHTGEPFTFGPDDVNLMLSTGLLIAGEDLTSIKARLTERVPGLVESEE